MTKERLKEISTPPPPRRGAARVRPNLQSPGRRTKPDRPRPGARRSAVAALLLLATAGIAITACDPITQPSAPATTGAGGAGKPPPAPAPDPAPPPTPTPQETEKRWAISQAHFRDDGAAIWAETSNRSAPFVWDRITSANAAAVRVSIDGEPLPLENLSYPPVFDADFSGAEWQLTAEVTAGAVVLVLTAEDQRYYTGEVRSVTLTGGGSGYTSVPTVEFSPPPAGGTAATATATGQDTVASVMVDSGGLDYTSAPTVVFSPAPADGVTATGTASIDGYVSTWSLISGGTGYTSAPTVVFDNTGTGGAGAVATATVAGGAVTGLSISDDGSGYASAPTVTFDGGGGTGADATVGINKRVVSVAITDAGSGYTSVPTVSFTGGGPLVTSATATAALDDRVTSVTLSDPGSGYRTAPTVRFVGGGGGSGAAAETKLVRRGYAQQDNLYWARQTLYGKQLLVEIVD